MTLESAKKNLEARGFRVQVFSSGKEAAAYLDAAVDGTAVGFGGSITLQELGLREMLAAHNEVFWHWTDGPEAQTSAARAPVYITSANALAETGEIVNIDGNGNRVSSTLYGHQKVYFLVGVNKIAPDFEAALWRARNVAAPKRAQSMGCRTPCAAKADRCYDCKSPERICRGLAVLWARPNATEEMEVVLIGEALGM